MSNKSLWYMLCAVLLGFYVLEFVRPGMFYDGVTYAAIAHNLSVGVGNVAQPILFHFPTNVTDTSSFFNHYFYEHPVLMFWIESKLYSILGDGVWVDKLFLVITLLVQSLILSKVVILLNRKFLNLRLNYLLVLIIWLMSDTTHGVMGVNFCDNFLTTFCLLSFLFSLYIDISKSVTIRIFFYVMSVLCVFLAMLCNGIAALAFLFSYLILNFKRGKLRQNLFFAITPVVVFVAIIGLFYYCTPSLIYNFIQYVHVQLLPSLNGGARASENTDVMNLSMRIIWYGYKIILVDNVFFLILIVLIMLRSKGLRSCNDILRFGAMFLIATLPIVLLTTRSVGGTRFFVQGYFLLSIVQTILLMKSDVRGDLYRVLSLKITKNILLFCCITLVIVNMVIMYLAIVPDDRLALKEIKPIENYLQTHKLSINNSAICSTDMNLVKNMNFQSYLVRYLSTNLTYMSNCDKSQYILSKEKIDTQNYSEIQLNRLYFYILNKQ